MMWLVWMSGWDVWDDMMLGGWCILYWVTGVLEDDEIVLTCVVFDV